MAYPAEGLESIFRNKLDDVAWLLNEKHTDHYLIVNVSNRKYDFDKFNNNVMSIEWPNHYPCPIERFLVAVCDVMLYLN